MSISKQVNWDVKKISIGTESCPFLIFTLKSICIPPPKKAKRNSHLMQNSYANCMC